MYRDNYDKIDIKDLKVGDRVFYLREVHHGWNQTFRYPIAEPMLVTKITPKRTKVILNETLEVDRYHFSNIVKPTLEVDKNNEIAKKFKGIRNFEYKFDLMKRHGNFSIKDLTDEEIEEVYELMERLYSKYKVEDNNECKKD